MSDFREFFVSDVKNPERSLLVAVIKNAYHDIDIYGSSDERHINAVKWFNDDFDLGEDEEIPIRFDHVCELLGLNSDIIRKEINKKIKWK